MSSIISIAFAFERSLSVVSTRSERKLERWSCVFPCML